MVAWISMFREFIRSGATDKLAWATQYEKDNKGTDYDRYTAGSIRVNLCHIEWANAHIIGGASACPSINHIIKTKSAGKTPVAKDTTTYKVRTISGADLVKELVANGVERKTALIIAKNLRFV
jgi:hypothetical protein